MDAHPQPVQPQPTYNRLSLLSFVLGLLSLLSPILTFYFMLTQNGGPGYVQSLFRGVPCAFSSILVGIISLALPSRTGQNGRWMAVTGMVLGILYFGISCLLGLVLLGPFLMGRAG